MPSGGFILFSLHAFAEDIQQLSGDFKSIELIRGFLIFQWCIASLIKSTSSVPKIPSSPACGFNPATCIVGFFLNLLNFYLAYMAPLSMEYEWWLKVY